MEQLDRIGKTALVLSAGGMFGAYQAGAYRAIRDLFEPDIIVGASVGALNAWVMASQVPADHLIECWRHPSAGDTLRLRPKGRWRITTFEPSLLKARANQLFDDYRPRIPFGLVVTEFPGMKARLVRDIDVRAEHLRRLAQSLFFLPAVNISGRRCLDGGLFEKLPIWAALEMGATRIIAIDSLPNVGPWWLHLAVSVTHAFKRHRRYPHDLDLTLIAPSERLGDANDAVFWKRSNIDRWIDLGSRDAAHALAARESKDYREAVVRASITPELAADDS